MNQKIMKNICYELWPTHNVSAQEGYLNSFKNWRNMIKDRPRIRCDGLYICKLHYVKRGFHQHAEYRPSHDVFTFKYLRFFEDGSMIQSYSPLSPKKFVMRYLQSIYSSGNLVNKRTGDTTINFTNGHYRMWNDQVVISLDD